MNGLIIRSPWIDYILEGRKTWEMRSAPTKYRGLMGLIRQGSRNIEGVAKLIDCLDPLEAANFKDSYDKHLISESLVAYSVERNWLYPWVLADVRQLSSPIKSDQKPGQVVWVRLNQNAVNKLAAKPELQV